ncbi:UNVERIFIED_CONTAM: hypothetical protein PYX00_011151 [Menopon gallinae]|uniref:Uncharacterized protein n=1 Tax=Menopon gallinae TaxID=328185 RepID=A0AAW2H6C2_9NEOP
MNFLREVLEEVKEAMSGVFEEKVNPITTPLPINILGYRLYKEQEKWIEFCFKEESKKIKLLLGARGYGKTEVITIYGTIKYIVENQANNPKVIILTRQQDRVKGIIRAIKAGLIEAGVAIKSTSNLIRLEGNNSKEANVIGLTINSRGIRGNHVDIVIMDDPVIALDEKSEIERQTVKSVYTECLNITKKIIVLGQPVHKEDLYATLKSIKEVDKHYSFYNCNAIEELNKDIELLRKTSTEKDIQRNFFNNLISNDIYPFSNIKVEEFNLDMNNEAAIDPAFKGEDSIGIAIGRKSEESNDNGGALRYIKSLESNISFKGYKETINKEIRIRSRLGRVKEGLVLHSKSDIKEVIDWNEDAKHDDSIDALASLVNFLDGNKDRVKAGNASSQIKSKIKDIAKRKADSLIYLEKDDEINVVQMNLSWFKINENEAQKVVVETEATKNNVDNVNKDTEALLQRIATLEQQVKEKNTKEDILTKSIREEESIKEKQAKQEALNNTYLDILSNFKLLFKEESEKHLQLLKNITNTEDRCNALAKQIIRKAYGDTSNINEELDSFKASVTNSDSAFYAKYMGAMKKMKEDRSSFNEQLFNPSAKEISAKDMKRMLEEAIDYRTKSKVENYILRKALAGSIANSKDIHCGDESVQVSELAKLKPGYACMLNDKGEVVVSDGTNFYGVRAEEIVPIRIGNTENSVSIGVRRKGIVNVVFTGSKEVAEKVKRGSYLKVEKDGSFTLASENSEAIGIAYSRVEDNIVALEFNADFIRIPSKPNEPNEPPKGDEGKSSETLKKNNTSNSNIKN